MQRGCEQYFADGRPSAASAPCCFARLTSIKRRIFYHAEDSSLSQHMLEALWAQCSELDANATMLTCSKWQRRMSFTVQIVKPTEGMWLWAVLTCTSGSLVSKSFQFAKIQFKDPADFWEENRVDANFRVNLRQRVVPATLCWLWVKC